MYKKAEANTSRFTIRQGKRVTRWLPLFLLIFNLFAAALLFLVVGSEALVSSAFVAVSGIVGFALLAFLFGSWRVDVAGEEIHYQTAVKKKTVLLCDIKPVRMLDHAIGVYSKENKPLFVVGLGAINYDLFVNYLAAQNMKIESEAEKMTSGEQKRLLKFQIWLSAVTFLLAWAAIIIGGDVLQWSIFGVRLMLFGSAAMLVVLSAGNIYIILSFLPEAKGRRIFILSSHILLALAVLISAFALDHIGQPILLLLGGSSLTLFLALALVRSRLVAWRRTIMGFVYFLMVASIFTAGSEGLPQMNAQIARDDRIYLQENTLDVSEEFYDFGRHIIELVDDVLYSRRTHQEVHETLRQLRLDGPRHSTYHEFRISEFRSNISWAFQQEEREEIIELRDSLEALLDRPRRGE